VIIALIDDPIVVREILVHACACLNGLMGCSICHHVVWSRPDAPHERDRDAEIRA